MSVDWAFFRKISLILLRISIYEIVLVFLSFKNFTNGTTGKNSIDKTIDTFNKIGGALMRQMVAGKYFSIY